MRFDSDASESYQNYLSELKKKNFAQRVAVKTAEKAGCRHKHYYMRTRQSVLQPGD